MVAMFILLGLALLGGLIAPIMTISLFKRARLLETRIGQLELALRAAHQSDREGRAAVEPAIVENLRRRHSREEEPLRPESEDPLANPDAPSANIAEDDDEHSPATSETHSAHVAVDEDVPRDGGEPSVDRDADDPGTVTAVREEVDLTPEQRSPAGLEHALTSRWLVWLGGATIALGGIFLVKYGIEQGLLSPAVRLTLSAAFGITLVVFGEWLRRRSDDVTPFPYPDYVPGAASAAGLAIMFGSVYGGYGLYDLLAPLVAFALLAGISLAAVALSLLQGPYIATLGLVGAYIVPLLIRSDADSPWPLFSFVLAVTAGGLGVNRYKEWSWLTWLSLVGSTAWAAIWIFSAWHPGDAASVSVFLFAILVMFLAVRGEALFDRSATVSVNFGTEGIPVERQVVLAASLAVLGLMWFVVLEDDFGLVGLVADGLLFAAFLYLAYRCRGLESLAAGAVIAAVLVLAVWGSIELADPRPLGGDRVLAPGWEQGPSIAAFIWTGAAYGTLFAASGFVLVRLSHNRVYWSAIGLIAPVAILIVLYWWTHPYFHPRVWGLAALGLALLVLAAAADIAKRRADRNMEKVLGIHALAIVALTTLSIFFALEKTWFTVALAAQLPVLGWVSDRFRVSFCRPAAFAIGVVVLVRVSFANFLPGLS